jgi:preprotein translocase subunit Sec63
MVYKTIVSVGIFVIALLYYYINVYDEVKSHYEVLGVSPKVSDDDIKKIYRYVPTIRRKCRFR